MINWINLEELADYLQVSRAYLYKEVQAGQIPAVKLGRSWRFDRDAIDRWLKGQESTASNFPWSAALDDFITTLKDYFGDRFLAVWLYGSWAREEARPDSDVDLMIVLKDIKDFDQDFNSIIELAYEVTFASDRAVTFSCTLVDEAKYLTSHEPLLLNVRKEGRRAA
jgi:uncharacterized protein